MRRIVRLGMGAWLSALALVGGTVVVAAPSASASADGCDNIGNNPRSCVQVQGSGTYVDWVRGGVTLRARGSTRGHFHLTGDGLDVTTRDETLSNDSFIGHTKWGETVNVGRDIAKGSKMCAAFIQSFSDGTYKEHTPACVTIA